MKHIPFLKIDLVVAVVAYFIILLLNMTFWSVLLASLLLYFGYIFAYFKLVTKKHLIDISLITVFRVVALYFIPVLIFQLYSNSKYVSDLDSFINPPFIPLYLFAIISSVITYYALSLLTLKDFNKKFILRLPMIIGVISLILPFLFIIR